MAGFCLLSPLAPHPHWFLGEYGKPQFHSVLFILHSIVLTTVIGFRPIILYLRKLSSVYLKVTLPRSLQLQILIVTASLKSIKLQPPSVAVENKVPCEASPSETNLWESKHDFTKVGGKLP